MPNRRALRPHEFELHIIEIHDFECDCAQCLLDAHVNPDCLTTVVMGKLATFAAVVVSMIMFAIDGASTTAALIATLPL